MKRIAIGSVEPKSREEKVYAELEDGSRLSSIEGSDLYRGDIEGEATWRGLSITRADGSGTFVSIHHLVCHLSGQLGSFILEFDGRFDRSRSEATWKVVSNTGTGGLLGISGQGNSLHTAEKCSYMLSYELD